MDNWVNWDCGHGVDDENDMEECMDVSDALDVEEGNNCGAGDCFHNEDYMEDHLDVSDELNADERDNCGAGNDVNGDEDDGMKVYHEVEKDSPFGNGEPFVVGDGLQGAASGDGKEVAENMEEDVANGAGIHSADALHGDDDENHVPTEGIQWNEDVDNDGDLYNAVNVYMAERRRRCKIHRQNVPTDMLAAGHLLSEGGAACATAVLGKEILGHDTDSPWNGRVPGSRSI